jgi:hypothetical protein
MAFSVADIINNNETRGFGNRKETIFFNNLMPNDTFLILVKIYPIKGTVYFV